MLVLVCSKNEFFFKRHLLLSIDDRGLLMHATTECVRRWVSQAETLLEKVRRIRLDKKAVTFRDTAVIARSLGKCSSSTLSKETSLGLTAMLFKIVNSTITFRSECIWWAIIVCVGVGVSLRPVGRCIMISAVCCMPFSLVCRVWLPTASGT